MKKILLDTLTSFKESLRNSTTYASSPRGLLFIPLVLVCFAFSPQTQAVNPPLAPVPNPALAGGNTADGQLALGGLTTGIYNSAFGIYALLSNAEANFNTGVGAGTLLANTASENTAVGAGALLSNTIGDQNTANGAFALFNNTEGIRNTAIGARALFNNIGSSTTVGSSNTAIGAEALGANTTGAFNVAVGNIALRDNADGGSNTAIGLGALFQATGTGNTALGRLAGQSITTGNNIIAIGFQVDGISTTNGELDDSCYIDNIIDAGVDAGTATIVFVDQDGKLGTTALPNTGTLPTNQALSGKVQELQSTVAQQAKAIDVLTAQLKEQAAQIQKVSAQLEVSKPAAQVVTYEQ
jgi:hypothetical protein